MTRRLWPGFSIAPDLAEGRATLAFDVRIDAKTDVLVRWADGPKAGRVGPRLRIAVDGVRVGKKILASPAVGQWVHITMAAEVNCPADRTWTLTVGAPGRRGQTFTHLPLAAPEWNGLGEVSFMSDGKTEAIWLFDNVTLTVKRTGNT